MLDSIRGELLEKDEDFAVIAVGGLRFRAEIPGSTASQLPSTPETVELKTRLTFNSNDGTFALFGFATNVERECYDILNTISGIGPRKALIILSNIEVPAFAQAILSQDMAYLSKIKGVGKKTAERLMLELREKIIPLASSSPAPTMTLPPGSATVRDAMLALESLGCKRFIAEKAVRAAVEILGEGAPTADLVREALKHR